MKKFDPNYRQIPEDKKYAYFSRFFHWIVKDGVWAKLSRKASRVYVVLLTFADYNKFVAFPGVTTISRLSGVARGSISAATNELVRFGLIDKKRASRRFAYRNVYRIIIDPIVNTYIQPTKTDKCWRPLRGKDGKFISSPSSTDNQHPSNTDTQRPSNTDIDIRPCNTDKKENLEIDIKRDNVLEIKEKEMNPSGSQETFPNGKSPEVSLKSHKSINRVELIKYCKELGTERFRQLFTKQNYQPSVIEEVVQEAAGSLPDPTETEATSNPPTVN